MLMKLSYRTGLKIRQNHGLQSPLTFGLLNTSDPLPVAHPLPHHLGASQSIIVK